MRTVPEMSACAWLLTGPPLESLRRLARSGIRHGGSADRLLGRRWVGRPPKRQSEGPVCGHHACASPRTGSPSTRWRRPMPSTALHCLVGSLERVASLGVKTAYMVTPPSQVGGEPTYIDSMSKLGDEAARLGLKLCVEPSPGFALGDYTETMRLLDAVGSGRPLRPVGPRSLASNRRGPGRHDPFAWRPPRLCSRRRQRWPVGCPLRPPRGRLIRTGAVQLPRCDHRLQLRRTSRHRDQVRHCFSPGVTSPLEERDLRLGICRELTGITPFGIGRPTVVCPTRLPRPRSGIPAFLFAGTRYPHRRAREPVAGAGIKPALGRGAALRTRVPVQKQSRIPPNATIEGVAH